jgi:20S proteasome alpha/beta subunit
MTVCIAAICRDGDDRRVVLCTDTRLEHGDVGGEDGAPKIYVLGWGWVALIAGPWSGIRALARKIRYSVQALSDYPSHDAILDLIDSSIAEFRSSPAFASDQVHELILSGFNQYGPLLESVYILGDQTVVCSLSSHWAIGSGGSFARLILTNRAYKKTETVERASYFAYEAKRLSQKAQGVGPGTVVAIQFPQMKPSPTEATMLIMNEVGITHLEAIYKQHGLQRVANLDRLRRAFFVHNPKIIRRD